MPSRRGRYLSGYPEVVDWNGNESAPLRDEFGMPLPFYIRDDLVDRDLREAYERGREDGMQEIRQRLGFDAGPEAPGKRKRRVFG